MTPWRCWTQAALLLSLAVLAASDTYYPDKRTESRPFVLGSRYGRSGPPATLHLAPRNDRFFMGSRYGKRSGGVGGGEAAVAAEGGGDGTGVGTEALACRYTGLYRLYHCAPTRQHTLSETSPHSSERNDITDEIITDDMKDLE